MVNCSGLSLLRVHIWSFRLCHWGCRNLDRVILLSNGREIASVWSLNLRGIIHIHLDSKVSCFVRVSRWLDSNITSKVIIAKLLSHGCSWLNKCCFILSWVCTCFSHSFGSNTSWSCRYDGLHIKF